MDTWNTKLIHTRERWSYYKDVNRGCTSLPTNTRRKTHVPPGERQTGISVRRQLPLSKFFCLRQTFFLPKPISLPSSTSRLTCLKMGTVFHCPFANYLTFFSPTTWNLFSTVSFPIYLGFFLTHNCKFIFLVNFFFSERTIWIIDVSFFIWSYGSQLSSVTKKSSFRFLVLSNDFFLS